MCLKALRPLRILPFLQKAGNCLSSQKPQALSYTLAALPAVPGVGFVPNKAEIAEFPAPTQGLGANEIRVGQIPIVDNVGPASTDF